MSFCTIEKAIDEIARGHMIILVDDEQRENEGDLVMAAEKVTPQSINFMAQHARGLICLALDHYFVARLNLPPMSFNNQSQFKTNFTVSIEAKNGVTTGISAFDRARTILTAIDDNTRAEDIVTPGHIFPLCAEKQGVLVRAGQTEGSVDLAHLAGYKRAAVICEIMNKGGAMARLPDLKKIASKHHLQIVQIKDLIAYRLRHDRSLIAKTSETSLPTSHGLFKAMAFTSAHDQKTHMALVRGRILKENPVLVRVHSECLTGDVFGSERCDCGAQLRSAMQWIAKEDCGVILYLRQEGRGIGLANKLKAYALQDTGLDTVAANHQLGFPDDLRDYGIGAQILLALGVQKMKLMTNNPQKIAAFDGFGLEVVARVPLTVKANPYNEKYLQTKKDRMNHLIHR